MNPCCQSCGESITTNDGEPAPSLCCGCAYARLAELETENARIQKMLDVCSDVHVHNVALNDERDKLRAALERSLRVLWDALGMP